MNLWVQRVLGRVVSLREDETKVALLMFAYSFLAMTAHNILKPVTGSTFIDQLGADNQPFVQLAVGSVHRRADALVQQRRPEAAPPARHSDHAARDRGTPRRVLGRCSEPARSG